MFERTLLLMRICFLFVGLLLAASIQAATLKVDPSRSQITLSGKVAGNTLREQDSGSLTTTIDGTIDITINGGQIEITGAALDPNVNGTWAPGQNGAAKSPADFGGQASSFIGTISGALRELLVTASSPPKTLGPDGSFDASSITFTFPTNSSSTLDYDAGFLGKGSRKLASNGTNQTATVGKVVDNKGVQTLTIALDAAFSFSLITENDSPLQLKGQLVADNAPTQVSQNITGIEIVDGQVRLTVTGTSASTRLESSTDLVTWSPAEATVTETNGTTRTYSVPINGSFRFYRAVE